MRDLSKYDEIIIWGACFSPEEIEGEATSHGHAAEKLYNLLKVNGYTEKICMWVDSNKKLHGKSRYGKPIFPPNEILNHPGAVVIINSLSIQAILNTIKALTIKNDILVIPYYFYHGVLDQPYDNRRAQEVIKFHGDEIKEMFQMDDQETRRYIDIIYEMRLKCEDDLYEADYYKHTGVNMDYFCDTTLAPDGDVTFIDVGAFEGESIDPIVDFYSERLKKCIVFEPDRRSFKLLKQHVKDRGIVEKTIIFPYALGDAEKVIRFSENGSTSQLSENGNVELEQKVYDELNIRDIIGSAMVKMDIEGAEEGALNGMRNFIEKYKPYLAICIYHKEDDIYKLPKLIKTMYPEYRLYIRGGWHLECWAVPDNGRD